MREDWPMFGSSSSERASAGTTFRDGSTARSLSKPLTFNNLEPVSI